MLPSPLCENKAASTSRSLEQGEKFSLGIMIKMGANEKMRVVGET